MSLVLEDVHTYYGASHILQGVSLTVGEGEVVALLGRNGAGKTTTMRSIAALTPPRRGRISLDGRDISHLAPHRVARAGIAYVPSGHRVFGTLTVRQNLTLCRRTGAGQERSWSIDRVYALFPQLAQLDRRRSSFLSGGEQQMLKLGRALLSHPSLLLLDEPTEGLAPAVVAQMREWLSLIKQEHISILLSEQNSLFALHLAARGYILEKGQIRHEAPASELSRSVEVRTYLGVQERAASSHRDSPSHPSSASALRPAPLAETD